jgi:hypothetical protein
MTILSRQPVLEVRRAANKACNFCFWCGVACALILVSMVSCSTISEHEQVADWPQLRVVEHVVSTPQMLASCYPALSLPEKLLGFIPFGCAWIDFVNAVCNIFVTAWAPADVLAHERLHCAGHEHPGSTSLRDALARWRAQ